MRNSHQCTAIALLMSWYAYADAAGEPGTLDPAFNGSGVERKFGTGTERGNESSERKFGTGTERGNESSAKVRDRHGTGKFPTHLRDDFLSAWLVGSGRMLT
jgi:hypothetical protein